MYLLKINNLNNENRNQIFRLLIKRWGVSEKYHGLICDIVEYVDMLQCYSLISFYFSPPNPNTVEHETQKCSRNKNFERQKESGSAMQIRQRNIHDTHETCCFDISRRIFIILSHMLLATFRTDRNNHTPTFSQLLQKCARRFSGRSTNMYRIIRCKFGITFASIALYTANS